MKEKKKDYVKARRKAVRPWKGISIFCAVICVVAIIATTILSLFDNTFSVFLGGGKFWKLQNEDQNAQYFQSDFESKEEKKKYQEKICEQVEAEGAVLLMNKDEALPLEKGAKVSLFSSSSVNLVYGGTGSGSIDATTAPNLKSALTDSGFEVNPTLWDFYSEGAGSEYIRVDGGMFSGKSTAIGEVPWDVYSEDVLKSVDTYGDAAIVTISRVGGEASDLAFSDYNYLELCQDEKDLLKNLTLLKKEGSIDKIIVLLNSSNTIQLDFLENSDYDIDACMWIGDVGEVGINAVGDILAGNVTPSGRLVDTYCYDNYSAPAMVNFGTTQFTNTEENKLDKNHSYNIIYQEGIYVGYRYYETRYEDYVMQSGNAGEYNYKTDVAYPFGYGLSYTDFSYSDMNVVYNESTDQFEVKVTVKNTGDTYSGKETVQVYSQSPYTTYDIENGVEKASVTLCGFAKTDILAPGESEEVCINVDKRDLASYDAYGAKTYILDDGTYYLTVAKNAHNAVNNVLTAKGYTSETTDGRMDENGEASLTYQWTQEQFDNTSYSSSKITGYKITNQFDHADLNLYEGSPVTITYLSRNDWVGTYPEEIVPLEATEQMIEDIGYPQYNASNYDDVQMPILEAKNNLKLYDMMGLDYDAPQWELLLDQLTFEDMEKQIGDAFHWTMPIESVQAPGSRDENGPQGLTASLLKGADIEALAFTSEDVMAATFNRDLISKVGQCIGIDCVDAGVAGLYGPGNNIHRTPYSGRNFEYYSEDGFLSGKMSAAEVAAIEEYGVNVMMKHFALNDCEENRTGLCTWANEQSIREIYLKAFQAPVEEAGANGVMTAYNRLGVTWAGADYNLITNVLRNEWGCNGRIITDNSIVGYMNLVDSVMAGGTQLDAMIVKHAKEYKNDPVVVTAMREAVHHNLYALVNSNAMNGIGENTYVKTVEFKMIAVMRTIAIVSGILFVITFVMWQKKKGNK